MFSFFKKKESSIKVIDKVCVEPEGKLELLFNAWLADKQTVFIFWFEDSLEAATNFFTQRSTEPFTIVLAREASTAMLTGRKLLFGEHYPLKKTETAFFEKMGLPSAEIYSSLKDPLFRIFGGERIIHLMQQLGMQPNEVIEHNMISHSIINAQEKLEKKLSFEQPSRTAEGWLSMNYKP